MQRGFPALLCSPGITPGYLQRRRFTCWEYCIWWGSKEVWKTTHAALREEEFERRIKCCWSMGPLAGALKFPFLPILNCFELSKCPWGSKANGITPASVQFRTCLNQCLVKKGLLLLGPVILHISRKVDSFCSLPTLSVFVLSGHEFKKDVPELTLSYWNQGAQGYTLKTGENMEAAVLQQVPVGQRHDVCACACAWMGSLLFKNLWSEFFGYFRRSFFSPSDCSPPPQQSDILFAVEFDRLRWQ